MKIIISIPSRDYVSIRKNLLPNKMIVEEVGFIFADIIRTNSEVRFLFREWYHIQPSQYDVQTAGHVFLRDDMRPIIIKRAHDLRAAVIEIHSHLGNGPAQFSSSDLLGFTEFVPHVRWRLDGRPYAAIVFTRSDFDALAWIGDGSKPILLTRIEILRFLWKKRLRPTGATLRRRANHGMRKI